MATRKVQACTLIRALEQRGFLCSSLPGLPGFLPFPDLALELFWYKDYTHTQLQAYFAKLRDTAGKE